MACREVAVDVYFPSMPRDEPVTGFSPGKAANMLRNATFLSS
jgi:hypothetical protein